MKTLRYGDRGVFTAYLQLALSRAGYGTGDVDGVFGTRTLNAVNAFQRDAGLTVDGVVGRATWGRLYPFLSGYVMHTVKRGDTLYTIAQRHGSTVSAIETANPDALEGIEIGQQLIVPLGFSLVPDNVPYSYALNTILLDGLSARYPFLQHRRIGRSVMRNEIEAATLGSGEKAVFYNASHHANEWITSTLLMTFLERYCRAVAEGDAIYGQDAKALFERVTLHVVPLVNPDGVDLVTGALETDDSYYEQAKALATYYPNIPFPSGWKANIAGTDLNLGYPAGWEMAKKIKFEQGYTRPGPRDYVGSAPLAEPENRAVYEYTRENEFLLTLSYHTQGQVIYYRYLNFDPPRATLIGEAFAKASGYTLETTPYESGFAGYKDWFIQSYDLPGYTVEAGTGVNPLPLSQFERIYADNEGILTLGMALI